jgi:hypothetical protein
MPEWYAWLSQLNAALSKPLTAWSQKMLTDRALPREAGRKGLCNDGSRVESPPS